MEFIGETWIESEHFVKECKDNMPIVIGCKGPELETHVPINGKSTKGNMDYLLVSLNLMSKTNFSCEGTNSTFRFYSKLNTPAA